MELTGRGAESSYTADSAAWNTIRLGDYVTFLRHGAYARADLVPDGRVKYLHYGDIHTADYVRLEPSSRSMPSLPNDKARRLDRLRDGDLVLVDASEDIDGVGKSVELAGVGTVEIVAGLHTIAARFDASVLADGFKAYLQFVPAFREHLRRLAAGTKVYATNRTHVASAEVPLPPVEEQRRIAIALGDMDELLERLTRLIAKKRDLKQAAMQQLLTGKVRLPGFTADWQTVQLVDVGDIRSGGTPSTGQPQFWDGGVPWCTPTDITALKGRKYLAATSRTLSLAGLKASTAELIPARSLIMTTRATIGECAINVVPMATNQGFKNIVPFKRFDVEYLYYSMSTQKAGLTALCGGSTFLEIGKKQLREFMIRVPSDREEQTAIATVLSDMDAELAALEARLEKTKALMQAMMQELLTGRTRLVAPEPAHA